MSDQPASIFITVTAPRRGDLPGFWTPRRQWPAGESITVEVVPTADGNDPEPFSFVKIGTNTLAQIEEESASGRLSYKTADGPATPVDTKGRLERDDEHVPVPRAAHASNEPVSSNKRRTFTQPHTK